MVKDFKCDEKCLKRTRWDRVNPFEFIGGRCGCEAPAKLVSEQGMGANMGLGGEQNLAVADWSGEDFFSVSLEEWSKLHELYSQDEQVETEDAAEDVVADTIEEITELGSTTSSGNQSGGNSSSGS